MLHAGTGRLMPGQTLVLPIVAGEPDPQGEVRYGLGGHLFGLYASDRAGGPASRVLFQRSTDCVGPYRFGEAFRGLPPADFLAAVEDCHAEGLPDRPDDVRLPAAPLPPEAFDSLCLPEP